MYNFDEITDRYSFNSLKWEGGKDILPMWVADMDFRAAPKIREALSRAVEHGIFGYSTIPDSWYDAYINWWKVRHNFVMEREHLAFCTGVVPAISSIVRKLTTPAEKVLIQTPVYNIFYNSIINNGRYVLENPLLFDGKSYSIDFDDLERKMADTQTTLMILCNPQNPCGRIWEREELARIGELAFKYGVTIVSDEIHCDVTDPGFSYVPFASVSDVCANNSVTCIAPTKAFNIAGINTAAVMVPNDNLRHRVVRAINTDEVAEPNAFACTAAAAAFESGDWLDEMRNYVFENKNFATQFLKQELPQVRVADSHATYLLWIDARQVCGNCTDLCRHLKQNAGIWVSNGEQYGAAGTGFIRMNIACPRETLKEGLNRFKKGIETYGI